MNDPLLPPSAAPARVHATAIAVGEWGVLIRGPSGAGKSRLALALLAAARRDGLNARLVGDDRVEIAVHAGRIVARGHPAIAGQIEERGQGAVPAASQDAVILAGVIDLEGGFPPRFPEDDDQTLLLADVRLPRLRLSGATAGGEAARMVLAFLGRHCRRPGG